MAQLRWQEPADGSDTLAIAQIRWHGTALFFLGLLRRLEPMPATVTVIADNRTGGPQISHAVRGAQPN